MKSFKDLKSNSSKNISKLADELKKLQTKTYGEKDERFWYPDVDNSGNGSAIIRFLPAPPNEDVPFVMEYKHSFKGPTGKYYIENCLTTIGQEDPVHNANIRLYSSGSEKDKEQATQQKRKKSFVSNIYVIKDPLHPENEGKVFLFRYGQKIFDKINELMNPSFDDDEQVNPFDLWKGANFRMKITTVDKWRNYDKSKFDNPGPLLEDDEELEKIWNSEHKLFPFVDPENKELYKPYAELEKKFHSVLGLTGTSVQKAIPKKEDEEETVTWEETGIETVSESESESESDKNEDDDLDWLKKIASGV